jgi:hypothetical protein
MLKPTEAIGKIKELLGLEFADTKQEKFYTSSLADGTPVTNNTDSEKLELGDTLYVVLEDGNLVPGPAGEHTLQSGEVIVLDEESKVVEIREDREEVEEEAPDEVEVVVEQKEIEEEMSEDTSLVELKNEISEMKEALSKVLDLFQDFSSQTEEEFSKVNKDIDTLKKEPEVENIKNKAKSNKQVVENFADYRVQQLKKYFN